MEKENTKRPELHIPLIERLKFIPEIFGLRINEEPEYKVLKTDGNFEVREYQPQVHAQLTIQNENFDRFRELAFTRLAAYIFGGNTQKENLAMTAPVMQQQGAPVVTDGETLPMTSPILQSHTDEATWTMSFILPSKVIDFYHAPTPIDPDIKLGIRPAHTVAVVKYSGNNTLEKMKEHERELNLWLAQNKEFQAVGKSAAAQYDAPFTIPFVKRNEIHMEVIRIH